MGALRVVDESLFASLDPVALLGSRCRRCDATVFPAQRTCPVCTAIEVDDVPLPTTGRVWSWTIQRFEPKPPFRTDGFAPFAIGYVDLGPVIVEAWLADALEWEIGDPVSLRLVPAWTDGDETVHAYAFARAEADDAGGRS